MTTSTPRLGEAHRRHLDRLRSLPVAVDEEGLRLGDQYVMFFAEAELMGRHARRLLAGRARADVLDVGLGLGVFAGQLARAAPPGTVTSYTAVEPHPAVAAAARTRVLDSMPFPHTVLVQPWQLTAVAPASLDAIMFDTWPPDGHADADFARFVAEVAAVALRPGGRFSFFASGPDLPAARTAALDRWFSSWTAERYDLPDGRVPRHWTKPTRTFLVPVATR
jgi:SAM-dependent methyltransferase